VAVFPISDARKRPATPVSSQIADSWPRRAQLNSEDIREHTYSESWLDPDRTGRVSLVYGAIGGQGQAHAD
jgi:hypothetical protein